MACVMPNSQSYYSTTARAALQQKWEGRGSSIDSLGQTWGTSGDPGRVSGARDLSVTGLLPAITVL
jgi:hypothetical protein